MAYGKITPKQQEILDFIKSEILSKGYPPAVRDICEAVHLKSTSSVHSHLETLEKNGYIRRGQFPIPAEYMPNTDCFMLKVKGESMINAGIFDGDYIMVRQQNVASNGEMIVALVDDSATVKTFYKENGHYRLQPENDSMDPIIVDDVQILGKVCGVFRIFL